MDPEPVISSARVSDDRAESLRASPVRTPCDLHPRAVLPPDHPKVTAGERTGRQGHRGCLFWLTGLSGAGKSTIATGLERELFDRGRRVYVLDGDAMRHGLCSDLRFSPQDRKENIRRVGEVAELFLDAGMICIAAFISPYRADRQLVRSMTPAGQFVEVYVNAPLEVCERRDPKGLYALARASQLHDFTGISAPYEAPLEPELELRTDQLSIAESVAKILQYLDGLEMESTPSI